MRANRDLYEMRRALAEAANDFEPVLALLRERVRCVTCFNSGWLDQYGKSTNRGCPECHGVGARTVETSGTFRAVVQVLRGTQRQETPVGILQAGTAILHAPVEASGLIGRAAEIRVQGVAWEVAEKTFTPMGAPGWMSAVLRRKA